MTALRYFFESVDHYGLQPLMRQGGDFWTLPLPTLEIWQYAARIAQMDSLTTMGLPEVAPDEDGVAWVIDWSCAT